ncbi:CHAP domain-containing protein [Jonesia quinghaiensis]|uniref:CHAP domain-containing protein n=1 Tax=Jonesia quinghaiensis TaxID=262806 RepID=UPI00048C8E93|nr:CHAP domain-containing protein [Jonesia quinghaiensis]
MKATRTFHAAALAAVLSVTGVGAAAPALSTPAPVAPAGAALAGVASQASTMPALHPMSAVAAVGGPLVMATSSKVTIKTTTTALRKGESFRVVAQARNGSGKAIAKGTVKLQFKKTGGKWKTAVWGKTSNSGKYSLSWRPSTAGHVRVAVKPAGSSKYIVSSAKKVTISSASRNLTQRVKILKNNIGSKKSGVVSLSAAQRKAVKVSGVKSVAYQRFGSAMIVRTSTSAKSTAFVVRGKIYKKYWAAGGPKGRYGVPVMDAQCGLIESGCVQRFSKGTIYSSSYKSTATGVTATGRVGEVAAVATSQVGFRQKWTKTSQVQSTKFNKWAGYSSHWCGHFVAWSAAASGNASVVPTRKNFDTQLAYLRKTMKTGKTPKVGAIAIMDTLNANRATHMGLVTEVKGGKMTVVEGNVIGNLPAKTRGVLKRVRTSGDILYYIYPKY